MKMLSPSVFHVLVSSTPFRRSKKNKEQIMIEEFLLIDQDVSEEGTALGTYQAALVGGKRLFHGCVMNHGDYQVKKIIDAEVALNPQAVMDRHMDFFDEFVKEQEEGDFAKVLLEIIASDSHLGNKKLRALPGGAFIQTKDLLASKEIGLANLLFAVSYYLYIEDVENELSQDFVKELKDKAKFEEFLAKAREDFADVNILTYEPSYGKSVS